MEPSFDKYKDDYTAKVEASVGFAGRSHEFFIKAKVTHLLAQARSYLGDLSTKSVLDVGCGVGTTDRYLVPHFERLSGVDVAERLIEQCRKTNPTVDYQAYDGEHLPYADGAFDVVFAICVLHHVPVSHWEVFLREMGRVTRPNGVMLVFEHNPWNPLTRRAVNNCEFDRDAVLVSNKKLVGRLTSAGLTVREASHILVAPFESKLVAKVENALRRVPLGAQHFVLAQPPVGKSSDARAVLTDS